MLKEMWKVSENLIDSAQSLPFYALVKFSEEEPDTVREMFKKLFSDEHMNYTDKQKAIDEFIESSEALRKKIRSEKITLNSEEIMQKINKYLPLLNNEYHIISNVERARKELQPYLEYLIN
ncbi:MAG: hypothetical protein PUK72_04455 [Oscillospiraceae bacterium]|nr:hypothetical protein [Oscillospiraceae bacterium]